MSERTVCQIQFMSYNSIIISQLDMEPEVHSNEQIQTLLVSLGYNEVREIGRGSFGQIYSILTNDGLRAIKTESKNNIKPMLILEYQIMQLMKHTQGFPNVYSYTQLEHFNYIEMQIFKKGLDNLLKQSNNKFNLKTTLYIMLQVLDRLTDLHKKGYIYRDLKPSNFMVAEDLKLIYILDFGLVKKIAHTRPSSPTKNKKTNVNRLVGTPLFCSVAAHRGENQGPKDDLQSLMYMGIYFLGPLPWQNIIEEDKCLKQQKIGQVKMSTKDEDLCKYLPKQFLQLLRKIRSYSWQDVPEYDQIKDLLQQALKSVDQRKNIVPEWVLQQQRPKQQVKINFQISSKPKKKVQSVVSHNFFQDKEEQKDDTK